MEAHAGCHIDIEIRVVHAMESPQGGHIMKKAMLNLDSQIERNDSAYKCLPIW